MTASLSPLERALGQLEATLDPGTYFFVVDGYSTGSAGNYVFELLVSDP